jgi:hypothetical protein
MRVDASYARTCYVLQLTFLCNTRLYVLLVYCNGYVLLPKTNTCTLYGTISIHVYQAGYRFCLVSLGATYIVDTQERCSY